MIGTVKPVMPFLKWAGGKQWLARRLRRLVPKDAGRYFEPFLGGGALYFALLPRTAILADINVELIETYRAVRDYPGEVINALSAWSNSKEDYYAVRATTYADPATRAARFVYLNKTCWNGLYRLNRKGEFNVPYGNSGREVFDEEVIHAASRALASAILRASDFEHSLADASRGDFVYLDPPYTVLHSHNGFRRYNERIFSWEDQVRLARVATQLADIGCMVAISNADAPEVRKLFASFSCFSISRVSTISGDPSLRRKTSEALFFSFEANSEVLTGRAVSDDDG